MLVAGAQVAALGTLAAACGPVAPSAPAPTLAPAPAAAAGPTPAAGATAAGAAPAASTGGQISVQWTKPVTFNPLYSTAGSEQGVERLIYGALMRVNDKLEAVPDLAEKVDVSPDATTYTFTLRKGINFSDGQPLTSKDVRFTFERAVDKRAATYWRGRLLDIQGATEYGDQQAPTISGLETPDDYTVKVTLRGVAVVSAAKTTDMARPTSIVLGCPPPLGSDFRMGDGELDADGGGALRIWRTRVAARGNWIVTRISRRPCS